jgi:hypothetical protein
MRLIGRVNGEGEGGCQEQQELRGSKACGEAADLPYKVYSVLI